MFAYRTLVPQNRRRLRFRILLALRVLLLRHLIFDDADDGHENRAADVGENALHIQSATASRCRTHHGLQNCPANSATEYSGNRIPIAPRLFSFMAAPATFPPTAPLTASIIKQVISVFVVCCFLFCVSHSRLLRLLWRLVRRVVGSHRCDLRRLVDFVEDESCDDGGSEVRDEIDPDIVPA